MTASANSSWQPATEAIKGNSVSLNLSKDVYVAVHFWAKWNQADKKMDEVIRRLKPPFEGWIEFYSCDVDDPRNTDWCHELDITSIPSVLVFHSGKKAGHIIGLTDEKNLATRLWQCLTNSERNQPWWKFW